MSERIRQYDQIAEGFTILAAYSDSGVVVGADMILAGPYHLDTKPKDAARLRELGWQPAPDSDCWSFMV
jgi:hypothetical protein